MKELIERLPDGACKAAATALADELEHDFAELADDKPESEAGDETEIAADIRGVSGGTAYDDLMLVLGRADMLVRAIIDAVMAGEDRDLVGLGAMVHQQLADAESICKANRKCWN